MPWIVKREETIAKQSDVSLYYIYVLSMGEQTNKMLLKLISGICESSSLENFHLMKDGKHRENHHMFYKYEKVLNHFKKHIVQQHVTFQKKSYTWNELGRCFMNLPNVHFIKQMILLQKIAINAGVAVTGVLPLNHQN